jgi:hypothetical protein
MPTFIDFVEGEPTRVGRTIEIRYRNSPNEPWTYDALVVADRPGDVVIG